jgi:hypothetical protein
MTAMAMAGANVFWWYSSALIDRLQKASSLAVIYEHILCIPFKQTEDALTEGNKYATNLSSAHTIAYVISNAAKGQSIRHARLPNERPSGLGT